MTVKMVENIARLPDGIPYLTTFYLYLTTGCNLACQHCWITPTLTKGDFVTYTKGNLAPAQYLDVDLLRQAIVDAKPLGLASAKLTGGEPTLHPDFVKIVDLLTSEGLQFNMETNGTLIDEALARHLKENTNIFHVSLSLDGDNAETHDAFRNVAGAFDAAVRGLRNLVSVGIHPQVIMSPHLGNINEVDGLVKLATEAGASSVKFNPVANSGRGKQMHEKGTALDFDGVMNFIRYVYGNLQRKTPIPLYIGTPPALSSLNQLQRNIGHCTVRNIMGILGDGELALCGIGRNVPELCFGKLGVDNLKDVWMTNPTILQLRKDLDAPYPGICGNCIHAKACQTVCVAQNYLDSGHLVWPSSMCQEAEERNLFPVSRRISNQRI
jgi:SynChlorMet cassette radical SAM/SPASM protein ScmF